MAPVTGCRHRQAMLSERTHSDAAHKQSVVATTIEHADGDDGIEGLSAELEGLADALRAASRAYTQSAARVVPSAQPLERGVCGRYQRAAANWPASQPPSHEQFAAAMASLHQAADAAWRAARRGDRARQAVDALFRPSHRS